MLKDHHVVVVGGGSGIGRSVAEASVAQGARVTVASRNADRLTTVVRDIGPAVTARPLDMTDDTAVAAFAAGLDPVDHLVITASSAAHGPFATRDISAVEAMFAAKFFGPYRTAKAVLPKMTKGGSITFFSGVLSRRPGENCSGLGAVNSAVEGLTRGLALELGPDLRINCISPGMVDSAAYAHVPKEQREKMYRETGASLPAGRVGRPAEIAEAVLFVMTNTYTTGIVLDVDGGHMIRQYARR